MSPSEGNGATLANGLQSRARVAIDLGAESCRVSLLRWRDGTPEITLIHRIPNGPVHANGSLRWPFDKILAGLEDGLRKAAAAAPEGIASIAVDGWAVDYVRLGADGNALANPHCYRDERTVATKEIGGSKSSSRMGISPRRRAAAAHQHGVSIAGRSGVRHRCACALGQPARICAVPPWRPPRGRIHQCHPHRPGRYRHRRLVARTARAARSASGRVSAHRSLRAP